MQQRLQLFSMLCVVVLACGGDESDMGFSSEYSAEIHYDCQHTVDCFEARDETIEDDPFNECLKDSAATLNSGDSTARMMFLANVARCKPAIECAYYDCAIAGGSGYGLTQAPKLQHSCQSQSFCRGQQGNPDANPTYTIENCVSFGTGRLDAVASDRRRGFEMQFATCQMLTGCEFTTCFGAYLVL
jgi:hypothetical protein